MKYVLIANDDDKHQEALEQTGFWGKKAAGAIIKAEDTQRILLGHRSGEVLEPYTWGSFGGAIDSDENIKNAVIREVREEIGSISIVKIIPLYIFKKNNFRYYNFLIVTKNEFDPTLNWENNKAQWFNFGEWPNPLHFGLKALLSDIKSLKIIEDS